MRKSCKFLTAGLIVAFILVDCASDQDPGFDNLFDEVKYLAESNFSLGGVSVGVISGSSEFTIFHGTKSKHTEDPPDENTLFQIGSITKTFTGIILAQMVIEGAVQLDDEVQTLLPADRVTMPTFNGIPIKLVHLATHTSGLERNLSDNYTLPEGSTDDDPFAGMTEEHIYDYLSNYAVLMTEPGITYEYSNFGFGLLGLVLSKVKNRGFKNLLKTVILDKLGMDRTSFRLTDEPANNIAVGHDEHYSEVEPWSNDHDLIGCGGLNSSLKDMMAYLKTNMGIISTQLGEAMDLSQQVHFDTFMGLGWHKMALPDGQIIAWHGGGSAGHLAFIAFNRDDGNGVVILYNLGGNDIPIEVGKQILEIARKYQQ